MSDGTNLGPARVIHSTDKAPLVMLDPGGDEDTVWIPKSVVHDDSEVYSEKASEGDLIVKAWWAKANGYGE